MHKTKIKIKIKKFYKSLFCRSLPRRAVTFVLTKVTKSNIGENLSMVFPYVTLS